MNCALTHREITGLIFGHSYTSDESIITSIGIGRALPAGPASVDGPDGVDTRLITCAILPRPKQTGPTTIILFARTSLLLVFVAAECMVDVGELKRGRFPLFRHKGSSPYVLRAVPAVVSLYTRDRYTVVPLLLTMGCHALCKLCHLPHPFVLEKC